VTLNAALAAAATLVALAFSISTFDRWLRRRRPHDGAWSFSLLLFALGSVALWWAEAVLGSVGLVVRVPETQLDVVTGLAGSGPAYLFLVAEALMDAGVASGLPRTTAETLVRQLFVGSAKLLAQGEAPADLRASVTSPGGTTAAGVSVLETEAVRAAFIQAVKAATDRSRELGNR